MYCSSSDVKITVSSDTIYYYSTTQSADKRNALSFLYPPHRLYVHLLTSGEDDARCRPLPPTTEKVPDVTSIASGSMNAARGCMSSVFL